ncbi:MAG: hypothetical protein PGN12_01885 [Sphingomonas phyllosphaerae]
MPGDKAVASEAAEMSPRHRIGGGMTDGETSMRRQVTAYMPEQEAQNFHTYARVAGIDASSLLVLLLLRAGRVGLSEQRIQEISRRTTSGPGKITAHFVSNDVYERASGVLRDGSGGLNPSGFCRVLVRLELEERWLAGEVGLDSR